MSETKTRSETSTAGEANTAGEASTAGEANAAGETRTASERITEEVTSWPGVEAGPGRRGELAFTLGRREIGHLHGDHALHAAFPKEVWQELFDQGRIDHHPVFPGRPGYAARGIEGEDDVRDAIELLRLNYDRAVARHGLPNGGPGKGDASREPDASGGGAPAMETGISGLHATSPEPLPFAPSLDIRAFLLRRERGNLLIYSTSRLASDAAAIEELGGISRHYLNHSHEAMFASEEIDAPLFVHEAEREAVAESYRVRGTFSKRHHLDGDFEVIPVPGHTPGATAYLWESGEHRVLFPGDTLGVDADGEWSATLLGSSDPESYIESLELLRELDYDVLVPWAAPRGKPLYATTDGPDARRRIDAILERLRRGEDR